MGTQDMHKCLSGNGTAGAQQKLWMVPYQAALNNSNYPSAFTSELFVKGGRYVQACFEQKDAETFG